MKPPSPPGGLVALSDWLYRRLLVVHPRRFRRDYGAELARVFRDCCRAADRLHGASGLFRVWLSTLPDLATTALLERLGEGIDVSRHG
jgi:hypothetical protein